MTAVPVGASSGTAASYTSLENLGGESLTSLTEMRRTTSHDLRREMVWPSDGLTYYFIREISQYWIVLCLLPLTISSLTSAGFLRPWRRLASHRWAWLRGRGARAASRRQCAGRDERRRTRRLTQTGPGRTEPGGGITLVCEASRIHI